MLKIACVFSYKESSWVSCQKIVKNLHLAYQQIPNLDLENFNYSDEMENHEIELLASRISDFQADVISIMDHKPHPFYLIQQILKKLKNRSKPKFIFHLFGDFTLYYQDWYKLSQILIDYEVEFLVASQRQKQLIDNLLKDNKCIVCPFPVNSSEFYYSSEIRKKIRQTWGVNEQDKIFVFTGRLSRQKRIKTLLATFANEFKNDPNSHLFIYGSPDNIGEPFLGRTELDGEYFRKFYSFYKKLPKEIQVRIHFKGSVPNNELFEVYQGCDSLINLSVHNDEDFGMSVAEAQACGLPAVLTDWGGLSGFEHPSMLDAVSFVPVKIGTYSKIVNSIVASKMMRIKFNQSFDKTQREKISNLAIEKFSIETVSKILRNVLNEKFSTFNGFGVIFNRMLLAQNMLPYRNVYFDRYRRITKLYRDIYEAYLR